MKKKGKIKQQKVSKKINLNQKKSSFVHPMFCFKFLDKSWNLNNLEKKNKIAFINKLCNLSQLEWNQVLSSGRHGAGCEKIDPDTSNLQCKLPPQIYSEDSNIYSFRYSGKLPFVGIRINNILHVIGIDINFKLYNHGK